MTSTPTKLVGPYILGPNETLINGIYQGDSKELSKQIPSNSIDLILTDPLYDVMEDYYWLSKLAMRILKPGGRLVLSDVLMNRGVEHRRSTFHEANYLPGLDDYAALARQTGYADIKVYDSTVPCWHGHFRAVVDFAHQKLLDKECDVAQLQCFLHETYRLVGDLKYYLLSILKKC